MTYERTPDGAIRREVDIEGVEQKLILRAQNVRKERTGVHATITIGFGSMILDEDTFNVDRREDRNRLGNAALKSPLLGAVAPRLKPVMEHELLLFLRGLWDFEIGKNAPEKRGGAFKRTAPPWLMKPYLLEHAGTVLFGPPGRGKSWTAYTMAVMVDAGYGFFYDAPDGGAPAMIVNLERSAESVDARLGDINQCLGLPRDRVLLRLDRRGRKFQDVADSVARVVDTEGVRLVVLDSLSRAGYGDLNANDDANRQMDALNAIGCAWLAIGHTPRGDESHLFGSQMQDAAADVMVQLISEEREEHGKITLGVGLKGTKANDVRRPPLSILAYEFDEIGLVGIRKPRPGEFLTIENESASMDVRGQVSSYLLTEGEASATAIARDTGLNRATVSKILGAGPEYESRRTGRSTLYRLRDNKGSVPMHTSESHMDTGRVHTARPIRVHTSTEERVPPSVHMHTSFPDSVDEEQERLDSLMGL